MLQDFEDLLSIDDNEREYLGEFLSFVEHTLAYPLSNDLEFPFLCHLDMQGLKTMADNRPLQEPEQKLGHQTASERLANKNRMHWLNKSPSKKSQNQQL